MAFSTRSLGNLDGMLDGKHTQRIRGWTGPLGGSGLVVASAAFFCVMRVRGTLEGRVLRARARTRSWMTCADVHMCGWQNPATSSARLA